MTRTFALVHSKLKSQRGASITYALLIMLAGVMISAVIITMAYSNVSAAKNAQRSEQNYLTVSSAAQMMRTAMAGDTVTWQTTTTVTKRNGTTVGTAEGSGSGYAYNENSAGKANPVADSIKDWVQTAFEGGVTASKTFTITLKNGSEQVSKVKVQASMSEYEIIMVFSMYDNSKGDYTMSLVFKPSPAVYDGISQPYTKTTDSNYYSSSYANGAYNYNYRNHYTVEWADGNISVKKGVVSFD